MIVLPANTRLSLARRKPLKRQCYTSKHSQTRTPRCSLFSLPGPWTCRDPRAQKDRLWPAKRCNHLLMEHPRSHPLDSPCGRVQHPRHRLRMARFHLPSAGFRRLEDHPGADSGGHACRGSAYRSHPVKRRGAARRVVPLSCLDGSLSGPGSRSGFEGVVQWQSAPVAY